MRVLFNMQKTSIRLDVGQISGQFIFLASSKVNKLVEIPNFQWGLHTCIIYYSKIYPDLEGTRQNLPFKGRLLSIFNFMLSINFRLVFRKESVCSFLRFSGITDQHPTSKDHHSQLLEENLFIWRLHFVNDCNEV